MLNELELNSRGYTVSYFRDSMNEISCTLMYTTDIRNNYLFNTGEICFTYPADRNKLKMFFFNHICSSDVIESCRNRANIYTVTVCGSYFRDIVQTMESTVVDILPALHALTGCN